MNKVVRPLMAAAAVSLAACGSMPRSANQAFMDCQTKECYLNNAFGAEREGITKYGGVLVCEDGVKSREEILKRAREEYIKTYGCKDYSPDHRFSEQHSGSHEIETVVNGSSTRMAITCALVNDTDLGTNEHCRKSEK